MALSQFKNICIRGMKTVIPAPFADVEDSLDLFGNSPKKLARAKKMAGYGRRYLLPQGYTAVDMCIAAAQKLSEEISLDLQKVESLIVVNQKPDYKDPGDACIAHGRLNLSPSCISISTTIGCSGYVHGLWLAHTMIASGAVKNCLLLAGDAPSQYANPKNKKSALLFGDAASATFLEYDENSGKAYFELGTDGQGWDRLITPFGGARLPIYDDVVNLEWIDVENNYHNVHNPMMHGPDVFNFSTEIAPVLITSLLEFSALEKEDIDFYSIHQANKQIVDTIISKADLPIEKANADTFSRYANNSTNSVVTVVCDQLYGKKATNISITAFGVGLSWGSCIVDVSNMHNGGICTFSPNYPPASRDESIGYWKKYFEGEK